MMNCRKAEQLIPLFVEADLDAAEMQQVSEHLDACATCRDIVAEFQSSQSSLHATALPVFDEAMLAEMRGAVMQQIAPPTPRTVFVNWLQPIWSWNFALAAAAVILLMVSVVIRQRDGKAVDSIDRQVADNAKVTNPTSSVVREEGNIEIAPAATPPQPRRLRKQKAQVGVNTSERAPENRAQRQFSPEKETVVDNQIASASITTSQAGNEAASFPRIDISSLTWPPALQSENALQPPDKSTSEPEMLRMEFQTADPNIRIIWLTPKSALAAK